MQLAAHLLSEVSTNHCEQYGEQRSHFGTTLFSPLKHGRRVLFLGETTVEDFQQLRLHRIQIVMLLGNSPGPEDKWRASVSWPRAAASTIVPVEVLKSQERLTDEM